MTATPKPRPLLRGDLVALNKANREREIAELRQRVDAVVREFRTVDEYLALIEAVR